MKAIFLDRDGTLNHDTGYLIKFEDFKLIEGTLEALQLFIKKGYQLFIVTNQSGIARGYFSTQELITLHEKIRDFLKSQNIQITEIKYCPHHPEGKIAEFAQLCQCRKPAPGMLTELVQKYAVDTAKSFMVGDKLSDALAGTSLGIQGILVKSGLNYEFGNQHHFPIFDNLLTFANSLE